jgi:hypothetical protein
MASDLDFLFLWDGFICSLQARTKNDRVSHTKGRGKNGVAGLLKRFAWILVCQFAR